MLDNMREVITNWIEETARELGYPINQISGRWGVEHPDDLARGDYATNVALVLAKVIGQEPLALAGQIAEKLKASSANRRTRPWVEKIEVAPPGFINFFLTRDFFTDEFKQVLEKGDGYGKGKVREGGKVMVEYTDPNPFKEFHLGHLMSNTIGEAISRLIESQGAEVKRACYQGDVGLHVAKAIYGMRLEESKFPPDQASLSDKAKFLGLAYVAGSIEPSGGQDKWKRGLQDLNQSIYERSNETINKLYDWGRRVSLKYFETIYKRLGTKFDYYFFESETGELGKKLVEENFGKVFERSDGAIIFRGEKYNLHTRVFLNSGGLPTYEAKELGLAKLKFERYSYDQSVVITGNEVASYFAVLKKVLELILPDLAPKTKHLPHGMLRLPTGKMSSRTGSVITAESLLVEIKTAVSQKIAARDFATAERAVIVEAVAIAAVKYSILKQSPGRDIIFDLTKSLSLEGDSGPYLQYAYVRARAVLEKATAENISTNLDQPPSEISELERRFFRFPEVAARAAALYAPNLLVTYLTELASTFNTYYAAQKIVDASDPFSPYRLALTAVFSQVLKSGLTLLALPVLEKM